MNIDVQELCESDVGDCVVLGMDVGFIMLVLMGFEEWMCKCKWGRCRLTTDFITFHQVLHIH